MACKERKGQGYKEGIDERRGQGKEQVLHLEHGWHMSYLEVRPLNASCALLQPSPPLRVPPYVPANAPLAPVALKVEHSRTFFRSF
jgi:hypothetical protein